MQHVRLMRGVRAVREHPEAGIDIDLRILSAGYGLVPHDRKLAPYEATFTGMKKGELTAWAEQLAIPAAIRRVLAEPYDLALILLGDSYLATCHLDDSIQLGGPALLLCGAGTAKRLPRLANARVVPVSNPEARRFSCGLVGLKGELADRVLRGLLQDRSLAEQLLDPEHDVLALLEAVATDHVEQVPASTEVHRPVRASGAARSNPDVDRVIELPATWYHKPHREKLRCPKRQW